MIANRDKTNTKTVNNMFMVCFFSKISLSKTPNKPKFEIPEITVPIMIVNAKIPNSSILKSLVKIGIVINGNNSLEINKTEYHDIFLI